MVPAAVVLVVRGSMVLGLTRGARIHDIHLPGGKMEPGDYGRVRNTAVRELAEETGLYADPDDLKPIGTHQAHTGHKISAYRLDALPSWPEVFRPTDAGWPGWVPPEALVQPWCTFREECRRIFDWGLSRKDRP